MAKPYPLSPVVWVPTGDGGFPYRAEVRGKTFTIRVNDFPAEPLYTLLIEGQEVEDLDDWPSAWVKPAISEAMLDVVRKARQPK